MSDFLEFTEIPISEKQKEKRICLGCQKEFEIDGSKFDHRQTYCSFLCRSRTKRDRLGMNYQSRDYSVGKCSSDIGAAAELLVCTDLLKQDLNVYRSVSPSARFDLIATSTDGRIWCVEVKRAVKTENEKYVTFGGTKNRLKWNHMIDVYAFVVLETSEIFYFRTKGTFRRIEDALKFMEIPHHDEEKNYFVEKGYITNE